MKSTILRHACLLLLSIAAFDAGAAERGLYLGAGASTLSVDYPPTLRAEPEPLGSSAWRIIGGYRVLDWVAVEANYSKLAGSSGPLPDLECFVGPCPVRERTAADTFSVSALAMLPRGPFDFYVRAGMTQWSSEWVAFGSDDSRVARETDESTKVGYGAGVQLHMDRFFTRLEYEHMDFGRDDAELYTLGVAWTF